jgi:flagellar hook-basal body complex protein FliE
MIDPSLKISLPGLVSPVSPPVASPLQGGGAGAFGEIFAEAVGRVEDFRVNAEQTVERFLSGEQEEIHSVAMATQRAELAFELFLQVKNKAVQAYQEVMRMQL